MISHEKTILNYYFYHDAKLHVISHWAETVKDKVCPPNIFQIAESLDKIVVDAYTRAPVKFEILNKPMRVESHMAGLVKLEFRVEGDKLEFLTRERKPSTETREARLAFGLFYHLVELTANFLQRGSDSASLKDKVSQGLV